MNQAQRLLHKAQALEAEDYGQVAVLMGGTSPEREVSLKSGEAVLNALTQRGINARGFDPKDEDLFCLRQLGYDRAFIALHGPGGEDGTVQGVLEYLRIPYTGSGVLASSLAIDKVVTKLLWLGAGIPTPASGIARSLNEAKALAVSLAYPVVLKPINQGSSIGVSIVRQPSELVDAYTQAALYGDVLMETFIQGPECTVCVVNGVALTPLLIRPAEGFFDFHAKYEVDTDIIPAPLSDEQKERLLALSLKAYTLIKAKGYARLDVMQDKNGSFWFLEINTIPGMTPHSLIRHAAKLEGLSFNDLMVALLASTVEADVKQAI